MISQIYSKSQRKNPRVSSLMGEARPRDIKYSGFLSPSGRVSVGFLPRERIKKSDREYERTRGRVQNVEQVYYQGGELHKSVVTVYYPSKDSPSLGLSSASNYHSYVPVSDGDSQDVVLGRILRESQSVRRVESLERSYYSSNKRGRYGLKGISVNGRKRVREGCYLLQRKYHRRLGFYTLTCPYTLPELIWEFNKGIAEIARRFFQDCKRFYEAQGQVWSTVFVYEYQSARYDASGIPVLHIHYVAPCYRAGSREWIISADEIRYLWMLAVSAVCGVEVDTSSSVDCQIVKTSAAGYLSKYLSKGSDTVAFLSDVCPSQLPSQWWGMTANVRAAIKKTTTPLPTEISEYFVSGGGQLPSDPLYLTYRRYIYLDIGFDPHSGESIRQLIGISAQLCPAGISALQTWGLSELGDI